MSDKPFEIFVRRSPQSLMNEVFLVSDRSDGHVTFIQIKKGEALETRVQYSPGLVSNQLKPAFSMLEPDFRRLLAAFQAYAEKNGMEAPSESFTKGKLEATEAHLLDVRTLLKLK